MENQREIKFRAWDKEKKRMVELNPYTEKLGFIHTDLITNDDWIVMQFTNLKGKNGKEIYEGDVVKGSGTPFEIIFQLGQFVGKDKKSSGWIDLGVFKDIYKAFTIWEIIGNIYENPELLK